MFDWQLLLVVCVVAVATAYLLRITWQAWRGSKGGCGGGNCSCASKTPGKSEKIIPVEDLVLRHRDSLNL